MILKNKLILGTAQFTGNYGYEIKKKNKINVKKILSNYKKKNFKYLDTSINYQKVDKKIGLVQNNWKIITKINFSNNEIENNNENKLFDSIIKSLVNSKKNIGIEKFDSLLIQNFDALKIRNKIKLFRTLTRIKKKKFFNKIGVSIYNFCKLRENIEKFNLNIIQCPYNILDRRIENKFLLKIIKKKKIEIHARSIFLQGILLNNPSNLPKKFRKYEKILVKFHQWATVRNFNKIDLLISFILNNKNINKIIIGIQNLKQLNQIMNHKFLKIKIPSNLQTKNLKLIDPTKW